MKIAIYSRKSKINEKGDSIDNQVQLCQSYIKQYFHNVNDIFIYKDEGFSGGNTNRPMFRQMILDAKFNKFDVLICYRLDRVSRNIAQFANIYEILQQNNIEFVSIKEQFDTSTPIGRAMLNIAMVFAQLERETIAERIRDNMHTLAHSGRWLGGTCPTGFRSEAIEYYDHNSNIKKIFKLSPIIEEIQIVKLIFEKFLELRSLNQVRLYLMERNIKTKNNCDFSSATIRDILTNPVYACADNSLYEFLNRLGAKMSGTISDYTGEYGASAYNRTEQTTNSIKLKNVDQWIISIGKHKGIISGSKWVEVQNILKKNKKNNFHSLNKTPYGLLAGIIKCGQCGSTMRLKKDKISKKTGNFIFYYVCTKKELSKGEVCNSKNINGEIIDTEVLEHINNLAINIGSGLVQIKEEDLEIKFDISKPQTQITSNNIAIKNLINQMSKLTATNEYLSKHFINKIKSLEQMNIELKKQLPQENDYKKRKYLLDNFSSAFYIFDDTATKRQIIRSIVNKIIWYENRIDIILMGRKND